MSWNLWIVEEDLKGKDMLILTAFFPDKRDQSFFIKEKCKAESDS